ncbi:anthranilate synthase component I family protein (plasmid) [Streptomyces sp. NBC_01591]|uniref:anthranilate synthase component I family protein n=1 Tax=Streptomyces sp. NBC_01591 TaxID=2975888 RepID=UPI002DDB1CB4|nr:anthranilate synthase component I family protein [Streptomyces sp. NBC_01591]WSD73938.1 anthranilate synthase component I family protein [Streptomyces sp. NBC_01591]
MTTLLDSPPRPAGPGRGPIAVRVEETTLAPHEPLDLYAALRERSAHDVFLLESREGPGQSPGATVVGHGLLAEIRVYADRIRADGAEAVVAAVLTAADGLGLTPRPGNERGLLHGDQVWQVLRAVQALFTVETSRPHDSYAFGFLATFGYGSAWHMETLPDRGDRDDAEPDIVLGLFRETIWYGPEPDAVRRLTAHSDAFPDPAPFDLAEETVAAVAAVGRIPEVLPEAPRPHSVRDTCDEETFLARVDRCLEHIGVGDIYQIQIGHRIDVESDLEPFEVYRRLRGRNPSPYMYLVPRDGRTVVGASPEVLFRTGGGTVVMRPIAGTAPRSGDPVVDEARVARLVADEKERAEHVMLVDLCRNDIGRVCLPGTLEARGLMTVETYSHVFHLVSTVEGTLAPEDDTWSVLRATFPAGTVTGAPKIRAMEIIEELESEPRGMYAGAVGLVDLRGWSQLALCIRTIVHDGRSGTYSTQSCAGIVADSSPGAEWRETLHKMGAAYWALTGEELLP